MFDLGSDFEYVQLSSPLTNDESEDFPRLAAGNSFFVNGASSPTSSTVSNSSSGSLSDSSMVFGSFLVDRNSSTPYTDATQVSTIYANRIVWFYI